MKTLRLLLLVLGLAACAASPRPSSPPLDEPSGLEHVQLLAKGLE